jgi:hypothetical protein
MARKTDNAPLGFMWSKLGRRNSSELYIIIFALLTIGYLAEAFLPKPNQLLLSHYHLSHNGYYWLVVPLVILLVIIWITSLYGSLKVKAYARLIEGSKDGQGMNLIGIGLLIQTFSLPIISNVNYLLSHLAEDHPNLKPTMTIIINYISLGLMALAFSFIFTGGHKLSRLLPNRIRQLPQSVWVGFFVIASALYSYFIIIEGINHPQDRKVYYLPGWLLVLTIVVPYIFVWYLGIRSAHNLFLYRRNVKGKLYRGSLSFLAAGIAVVILASVATRVITSLSSGITNLEITPLLMIIYGLLSIIAMGYVLIAVGAKKLRDIEEV